MLEVLKFIFSSFWIWCGAVVLIIYLGEAISCIIQGILKTIPWTYSGMKRRVLWNIIEKDVMQNKSYSNKDKIQIARLLLKFDRRVKRIKFTDDEIKNMIDKYFC